MATLSKPKFKINRNSGYRSKGHYDFDNGSVAFGDHIYNHKRYNLEKYRDNKTKAV
jgi:hypothetical protein